MALTRLGLNQAVNLATNTTGTLAVANGGTGLSSGFINGTTNVGKVLQVVGANVAGGNVSITSTSYTDTGCTATITPSSSSSKILVFARGSYTQGATDDNVSGGIKLVRNIGGGSFSDLVTPMADTTGPYEIALELTAGGNINNRGGYYNYCFLDSPNTTSACIFKIQARPHDANNSRRISFGNTGGGGGGQSQQMILQEISA